MRGVAAEFQNVPLRDSQVLEELPCGVWHTRDPGAPLGGRKSHYGGVEIHVRAAIAQKISEMLAQRWSHCGAGTLHWQGSLSHHRVFPRFWCGDPASYTRLRA